MLGEPTLGNIAGSASMAAKDESDTRASFSSCHVPPARQKA